jgi:hypothetical protein
MADTNVVPLSAFELRDAMRNAAPYDPARLSRILRIDRDQGVVEVQANTPWRNLAAKMRPNDDRAAGMPTSVPSIGESIARNAAGPDGRPAVAHIESMTIVTPDGELRRISRYANRDLFSLVVGGQGLFGALYSVTLRVESMRRALEEAAPTDRVVLASGNGRNSAIPLLVAQDQLSQCLAVVRECCEKWRFTLESVEARRVSMNEETFLRWAAGDYLELRVYIAEPESLAGQVRKAQLARELIDVAIAHGGGFPIAGPLVATRAQAEVCYPQLKGFLAEKRTRDPLGRLVTPWYAYYRDLFGARGGGIK